MTETTTDRVADRRTGSRTTDVGPGRRGPAVAVLFASTSFLGAGLLFMVQPLAAKLVLPSFGGSATVWSTSSLLFQVLLLLGYVYAHVSTRRLGARWQPRAHLLLLALPLLVLPIALPAQAAPPADGSPVLWLLRTLVLLVGLPFAVLSATGPLVQRWYAWSDGPRADDPYFLFAGSNLGSFAGLLAYPFLVEPHLTLTQQRVGWSVAFGGFLVLMAACALTVRRPRHGVPGAAATPRPAPPSRGQLARWCLWAFLPSSLMLSVTAHLSTDIAAVPLLWVLPLAAYLASFVAAFARTARSVPARLVVPCVTVAVTTGVTSALGSSRLAPVVVLVVVANVLSVALAGFAAHARLAASRPEPEHLTLFYLVVSVGGALGGLLNGVVAPLLFDGTWEHLLTVALLPVLAVGVLPPTWTRRRVLAVAATPVAGVAVVAAARLVVPGTVDLATGAILVGAVVLAVVVGWLTLRAPAALTVTLLLASLAVVVVEERASLLTERTFYGSYRVQEVDGTHRLLHGTTVHGSQFLDPRLAGTPTTYYASDGPFGDAVAASDARDLGVVGLGAGAIAAYDVDRVTFFEIDPVVADIARDQRWFGYLQDSAAEVDVVVGDGRLAAASVPEGSYDLLALDAFSSDSIPVHVLTREGVQVFLDRVRPDGALAVHISNRVFDLRPVLAAHARDLGLRAVMGTGGEGPGAVRSEWVVLTRSDAVADDLLARDRWRPLPTTPTVTWTDDYSSVLSVLR